MKIVKINPNSDGSRSPIQSWNMEFPPDGYAVFDCEIQNFISYNGFVNFNIEIVDGVQTVTSYEPNIEAWEAWKATQPDPLETERSKKLSEISTACNDAIIAGIDVEIGAENVHFNLALEDQANISNLFRVVELGGTAFPYQADGGVCAVYTAAEIATIYTTAQSHITYHLTYHNALKQYVQSLTTTDAVQVVTYGMELPEPYKTEVEEKLSVAIAQMDAIMAKLQ